MKMIKENKKLLVVLFSAMLIALLAVVGCGKEEGYRLIQVYEVNGQATIDREKVGSMDAYENLNLLSGDRVATMIESTLRLKLDEDKYLLAEENTIMELVAAGDAKKSRTNINLLQGGVTIQVNNKLDEEASFEVTTPNSVMAIRGTVFRVTTDVDEKGNPITKVAIFKGAVGVQKKDAEGNMTEETLVPESKEAIIYIDNEEEVLVILDEIEDKEKEMFTVTFTYNGKVFGTQEVLEGDFATQPTLMPAPSGSWEFDFTTPITADTEIEFVE